MAEREHSYEVSLEWTGNRGSGTSGYREYGRDHEVTVSGAGDGAGDAGRPQPIAGSSDSAFRGDPGRWNPEELLVGSLSSCHQLWYLHLCAVNKVRVLEYRDHATGLMAEHADGSGEFTRVILRPEVVIAPDSDGGTALRLHHDAGRMCFVARSMNFPVDHEPTVRIAETG